MSGLKGIPSTTLAWCKSFLFDEYSLEFFCEMANKVARYKILKKHWALGCTHAPHCDAPTTNKWDVNSCSHRGYTKHALVQAMTMQNMMILHMNCFQFLKYLEPCPTLKYKLFHSWMDHFLHLGCKSYFLCLQGVCNHAKMDILMDFMNSKI